MLTAAQAPSTRSPGELPHVRRETPRLHKDPDKRPGREGRESPADAVALPSFMRPAGAAKPQVWTMPAARHPPDDEWAALKNEALVTRSNTVSVGAEAIVDISPQSESAEVDRLRLHCEELLRLNAELRQRQLEVTTGTFAGKFDNLLREFGQMRGFHQTMRGLADVTAQVRKDLKELAMAVSPVSEMSSLMDVAVGKVRSSLQQDVRDIVSAEVATLREQLTRLHENSTTMVNLTLQNRKDFADHQIGLSSSKLDELLQLGADTQEAVHRRFEDIQAEIQFDRNIIDNHSKQIGANMRSIEENKGRIMSNQQLIRDEQDRAREEAKGAIARVQSLQEMLRQEHSAAERAKLERQLSESEKYKTEMESELSRLQDEMHENLQQEIDDLHRKFDDVEEMVGKILTRMETPEQPTLLQQLHRVSEIQRRGNLDINLNNGDVALMRPINFKRKNLNDPPTAEFENEKEAMDILTDLCELWQMFKVSIVIEGHTKDIGVGPDEFWQSVANGRAALVAATMGVLGVDLSQVAAVGKPGKTGLNKAALVISFDLFPDLD
ncbi:unnamed protein product [Symbiodinium natans]|uniref:OmpA-like domain-containing protein n=1 Tax=Symbiodinium natans TaxID=878477 RepID=A0A812NQY0_9DINO|nr:unnamed protein product [Symbiodinium natans]